MPGSLEDSINVLPGVVDNGMFAHRLADKILVASARGVSLLK
jgi:ribose 5-phosphate isomerase A